MNAEPSPRPWHYEVDSLGRAWIRDADGNSVWPNSESDVALIVAAVNERDRLPRVGIIIEATPDELAALPFNPVYAEVRLAPANGAGETPKGKGVGR